MEIAIIKDDLDYKNYYVKCPPQKRTIILDCSMKTDKSWISKGRKYFFLQFPELIFLIRNRLSNHFLYQEMRLYGVRYLSNVGSNGVVCLGKNYVDKEIHNQTELVHYWISNFWNIPFSVEGNKFYPLELFLDYYNLWQKLKRCPTPNEYNLPFYSIVTPNLNYLSFKPLNKT